MDSSETAGVVRIGSTVRRPVTRFSGTIHALLRYLEDRGFDASPRFLGIDDQGRETLSFIEGEAGQFGSSAHDWSDESLIASFQLLRRYHDATVGFRPPSDAVWRKKINYSQPIEVVCHNDFAPYNCIFQDRLPTGIIDFDYACPGSRPLDVAFAIYRFAPLSQMVKQPWMPRRVDPLVRVSMALESYGLESTKGLLEMIIDRVRMIRESAAQSAKGNDANAKRIRDEKHVESYDADLQLIESLRPALTDIFSS